jgi:glycosyltransferase involved in cell wall biosynthesis
MGSIDILSFRTDRVVYTTEKNLRQFSAIFQEEKGFVRIDNALPDYPIHPISRSEIGIPQDAFVLCLVSRALPEKGWQEAIDAVIRANKNSSRPIYLILIGDGPEYLRLKEEYSDSKIIFLGFKKNIRDYFAASDMGFLPSRYPGESFPLVIIDCLKSGTPALASDLGEIRNMLTLETMVAGHVFDLKEMKIDVNEVASIIQQIANDRNVYNQMKANVASIAERFDMEAMCLKYSAVYCEMKK